MRTYSEIKESHQNRLNIANTIMNQLGGRHFISMTGADRITAQESGVKFFIKAKNENKINLIEVILTPEDTYTMICSHFDGWKEIPVVEVCAFENVYCDELQDIFSDATGLCTHL
jgi:hypothetical protein